MITSETAGPNSAAPSLSVVVPLYREEGNVAPLLARIHEGLAAYGGPWELICVDDGSTDRTVPLLKSEAARYGSHVRVICFHRNFGQTAAMQAGIDAARGELIATLDGDLQNDPDDIPRMAAELQSRELDLLVGWRADRQDAWLSRKLPSRIANRLIARVTGVRIRDYGCSLKLYRASVIKQVRLFGEMHRLIPVWVAMVTSPARIGETEVKHHPRHAGESKYGISRTFRVLLDLLTAFFFLKFQARPGHFFGSIGLLLGFVGGAVMAYLATVKFVLGHDIGNRPLFFTGILLLMFAAQFLTTGVLAEMVTRVFHQARRPPYSAEEITGLPAEASAKTGPESAGWRRPDGQRRAAGGTGA